VCVCVFVGKVCSVEMCIIAVKLHIWCVCPESWTRQKQDFLASALELQQSKYKPLTVVMVSQLKIIITLFLYDCVNKCTLVFHHNVGLI